MLTAGVTVSSRLRSDSMLFYLTIKERTGKRGRPFVYDGKVDFNNLDEAESLLLQSGGKGRGGGRIQQREREGVNTFEQQKFIMKNLRSQAEIEGIDEDEIWLA